MTTRTGAPAPGPARRRAGALPTLLRVAAAAVLLICGARQGAPAFHYGWSR